MPALPPRQFMRMRCEEVRVNELDHDDLEDLNERRVLNFVAPEGYITLCARNATADAINRKALSFLTTPEFEYLAEVKGRFDPALYPTEAALRLRQGAQVMFVKNDPVERLYVNGTIGQVVSLGQPAWW